jgi:hypothetical protein
MKIRVYASHLEKVKQHEKERREEEARKKKEADDKKNKNRSNLKSSRYV